MPTAPGAGNRAEHAQGSLAPLECARCGAPQPIGDADSVRCARCGTIAPLPPAYRHLRDAKRMSENDAARLDALSAAISRPPSAFQRAAIILGYGIGILTLVVFGVGALLGAILGVVIVAKMEADGTLAVIVIGLVAILCGVMSVPFVGEWVVGFATLQATDAAYELATGSEVQWGIDAVVGGILYFMSIVPIAIAWRTSENVSSVKALQSRLAAAPPLAPGMACRCRSCGAALDLRPGALAARCVYCATDNLVAVPLGVATAKSRDAEALSQDVAAEVAKHEASRRGDRRTMWTLVALGPLLVPLLCGAGWLLHQIASS